VADETRSIGMKKFKVYATMFTYLVAEVEAESVDEAWKIGRDMDGGSFTELDEGDWEISDVMEVE